MTEKNEWKYPKLQQEPDMQRILLLLFVLQGIHGYSQMPTSSELLAQQICPPNLSDRQKVEAIFQWITSNISYNLRLEKIKDPLPDYEEDSVGELRPLNHRVAETVLKRRQAVCDGYARLFKTLCDHAGVKSEHITGYARTSMSRSGERFKTNHSWNAVYIDSNWYLLDVTWASGYITWRSKEFIRSYDETYFLTSPARFVQDHYPEDPKWTLMDNAPVFKEFDYSPLKYGAFTTSRIVSFSPSKGIIDASVGDTINFELTCAPGQGNSRNVLLVSDSVPPDPDEDRDRIGIWGERKISFPYVVTESTKWIYVIWNGQPVLRYYFRPAVQKLISSKTAH